MIPEFNGLETWESLFWQDNWGWPRLFEGFLRGDERTWKGLSQREQDRDRIAEDGPPKDHHAIDRRSWGVLGASRGIVRETKRILVQELIKQISC